MLHIWHEDSANGATTQFWEFICKNSCFPLLKNAEIAGSNSNDNLVKKLAHYRFDVNDIYYIFLDRVPDNPDALQLYDRAKQIVSKYKNIVLSDLLCFEYLMLSFKYFSQWVKLKKRNKGLDFADKTRVEFIQCINNHDNWINYKQIKNYVILKNNLANLNSEEQDNAFAYITQEQIAYQLLCDMCNSGVLDFRITKTCFGTCWTCNCCDKNKPMCNLYKYHKDSCTKAMNLWNCTVAHKLLSDIKQRYNK